VTLRRIGMSGGHADFAAGEQIARPGDSARLELSGFDGLHLADAADELVEQILAHQRLHSRSSEVRYAAISTTTRVIPSVAPA